MPIIEENIILALNNNEKYRNELASVMESLTHQKKVTQDLIRDAKLSRPLPGKGYEKDDNLLGFRIPLPLVTILSATILLTGNYLIN